MCHCIGLARSSIGHDGREGKIDLTNNVVTMWYKAPELLLGSVRYSAAVDIWSAGCVLAELELGRPIFPGKTEVEQFDLVSRVLGLPGDDFSGASALPNYDLFVTQPLAASGKTGYTNTFKSAYHSKISEQAIGLLERAFTLDPDRRPSAKILLTHSYFFTYPAAGAPGELEPLQLAAGVSMHEFETKQRRKLGIKVPQIEEQTTNAEAAVENVTYDTFPTAAAAQPIDQVMASAFQLSQQAYGSSMAYPGMMPYQVHRSLPLSLLT